MIFEALNSFLCKKIWWKQNYEKEKHYYVENEGGGWRIWFEENIFLVLSKWLSKLWSLVPQDDDFYVKVCSVSRLVQQADSGEETLDSWKSFFWYLFFNIFTSVECCGSVSFWSDSGSDRVRRKFRIFFLIFSIKFKNAKL